MDEIEFRNTSGLKITEIGIKYNPKNIDTNPVKAFVQIVINDVLVINDIKVIEGRNGFHISWPSQYDRESGKRDAICYPISSVFKNYVTDRILREFKKPEFFNLRKA